ncbi:MAG: hypothetical protein A2X09_16935 [Bacteroidetes bacterium GWF2_43_11]|nr:MAG: hypothetical protein A2X09_16935 [Bacteroidetes bacterium GWF2_43_11]
MAAQKLFLLHISPFSFAIFHICSVLNFPLASSLKAQRKISPCLSSSAMYFFPDSVILFIYPTGAGPIQRPSFLARLIP